MRSFLESSKPHLSLQPLRTLSAQQLLTSHTGPSLIGRDLLDNPIRFIEIIRACAAEEKVSGSERIRAGEVIQSGFLGSPLVRCRASSSLNEEEKDSKMLLMAWGAEREGLPPGPAQH